MNQIQIVSGFEASFYHFDISYYALVGIVDTVKDKCFGYLRLHKIVFKQINVTGFYGCGMYFQELGLVLTSYFIYL
jgi:uncharacterized membrane protein